MLVGSVLWMIDMTRGMHEARPGVSGSWVRGHVAIDSVQALIEGHNYLDTITVATVITAATIITVTIIAPS